MVYHNLYHRVDGILLTSSKYGECQLRINRGGGRGVGANQKRRNILSEKIMVFRVKCAYMFFV